MAVRRPPLTPLATVRRFEAAGFRAWPASSSSYDGTWLVRLTREHPAKRLNSVNPLDPGDAARFEERIARARARFERFGRPLTFRLSPLAGYAIVNHLDEAGWHLFSESQVMRLELDAPPVRGAIHQIPLKDIRWFVNAVAKIRDLDPGMKPGLAKVIGAIEPEAGLFVLEQDKVALATAICVHDGDLAGLFEVATDPASRGRGLGRRLVLSALKWAQLRGAKEAWLQVEADNEPALRLYTSLGFEEVYRYRYCREPGT